MLRRLIRWELSPLFLLTVVNLIIAFLTVLQYGESWDESSMLNYAEQSIGAYQGLFQQGNEPVYDDALRFYGPAYAMLQLLIAQVFPLDWFVSDVGHLVNFVMFQVGLVAFYFLSRRWFTTWAAFCATILFSTQPLFWGHAFFNSKDIPFMTLFLVTILTGLRMLDEYSLQWQVKTFDNSYSFHRSLSDEWHTFSRRQKRRVLLFVAIGILGIIICGAVLLFWKPWLAITPADAYEHPKNIALEIYLRRLMNILFWVFTLFSIGGLWLIGILRFGLPLTGNDIWRIEILPFLSSFRRQIANPRVLVAGCALGLVVSVRALGLAAVLLVMAYALKLYGKKILPLFIPYALSAAFVIYITWPYLWPMPVVRFLMSLKAILQFPWPGEMLFNGAFYSPDALPWYSIPWLIIVQLTEPVVLLSMIGFGLLAWKALKRKRQTDLFVLVTAWFILPLGWTLFPFSSTYDNFRQLFFILPPVFLMLGEVFDWVREKLHHPILFFLIPLLLIIPGAYAGIQLHPYEYIYYNYFVGGIDGAFRKYETDYWTTSYRAATDAINELAMVGSNVYVWGPAWIVEQYAREDLQVHLVYNINTMIDSDTTIEKGSYIVLSSRYNYDFEAFPNAQTVHEVVVEDIVLSVVKYLPVE